jgi:accessory gene regulator protein AgrB
MISLILLISILNMLREFKANSMNLSGYIEVIRGCQKITFRVLEEKI